VVVQVVPLLRFTASETQPVMVVLPSLKVTVPVGEPPPGETTESAAVKVTDWPLTAVNLFALRLFTTSAFPTLWAALVEVVKLLSPL
jgi:hypothetical protein